MIPDDLRYTAEHEWVRASGDSVRVGITHFAQDSLGDVVFVELPEAGTAVSAGQAVGEIESTKSVSDVYSPVSGTVTARNEALGDSPDLINREPYGEGWMLEIEVSDSAELDGLLDAAAYRKVTGEG
ncbi:glycine cleavage system H protein [Actinocatenispora thailandica]|uniref:Glycine cleavage system H protein n=1 Tax=Actinocatenispora thailandica TaxID=227318 RepID=A0A7R7DPM9_9ACTN|nr:glycine cleavage system protein GcvH [Actinocatenispora thailandica]BCJ35330.1 glycine cleavage system H protein [Actinocatenispora thailandica]